jgi:hypothetical protein
MKASGAYHKQSRKTVLHEGVQGAPLALLYALHAGSHRVDSPRLDLKRMSEITRNATNKNDIYIYRYG